MRNIVNVCITTRSVAMRTTLDLPENLLKKAMSLSQIKTKTQVITTALQEMIRKSEIADLKDFKGKVDVDIDLDTLRGR